MTAAVVYLLVATAILLFLNSSPSLKKDSGYVRLGRRLGDKHAPFDPLVGHWERLKEEGWERQNEEGGSYNQRYILSLHPPPGWDFNVFSGEFEDPEAYFSEEGQLNITGRLQILFPLLDRSPKDGAISFSELEAWNVWQANDQLLYRTRKELFDHDNNGDGFITLEEYIPHYSDKNIDRDDMNYGQEGWWTQKFLSADIDRNGRLNFTEIIDFLHPEDSDNENVQLWLLKETMREMDEDKDGKLDFTEFHDEAYDVYKNRFEFTSGGADAPSAEEKFSELDEDKDRFLTQEELRPLVQYIHPGERTYAKYYTKHLINQADDNNDGKLELHEMLDHSHIFYSTVIDESEYDDDDDDDLHDEFR